MGKRALCLCLGLLVAVGPAAAVAAEPRVFRTTAHLLIEERPEPRPAEASQAAAPTPIDPGLIETHAVVFCSPLIAGKALKQKGLEKLVSLAGVSERAAFIAAGLSAGGLPGGPGNVLVVHYDGPHADDGVPILTAVIDAYREFLADASDGVPEGIVARLRKSHESLSRRLTAVKTDCQRLGKATAEDPDGKSDRAKTRSQEVDEAWLEQQLVCLRIQTETAVRQRTAGGPIQPVAAVCERYAAALERLRECSASRAASRERIIASEVAGLCQGLYEAERKSLSEYRGLLTYVLTGLETIRSRTIRVSVLRSPCRPTRQDRSDERQESVSPAAAVAKAGSSRAAQAAARVVFIDSPRPVAPCGSSPLEKWAATNRSLSGNWGALQSRYWIRNAIVARNLQELPALKNVPDPVEHLRARWSVSRAPSRPPSAAVLVVDLCYRGANRADCQEILAALIEEYRRTLEVFSGRRDWEEVCNRWEALDGLHQQVAEQLAAMLQHKHQHARHAQAYACARWEAEALERTTTRGSDQASAQTRIDVEHLQMLRRKAEEARQAMNDAGKHRLAIEETLMADHDILQILRRHRNSQFLEMPAQPYRETMEVLSAAPNAEAHP